MLARSLCASSSSAQAAGVAKAHLPPPSWFMAKKRKLRKEEEAKEKAMRNPTYGLSKRLKRLYQLRPFFKRGAGGLYGGKFIGFGNRISEHRNK